MDVNTSSWDIRRTDLVRTLQGRASEPGHNPARAAEDLKALDSYQGECLGDISRSVETRVTAQEKAARKWSLTSLLTGAVAVGGLTALAVTGAPVTLALAAVGAIGAGLSHLEKRSARHQAEAGRALNDRLWTYGAEAAGAPAAPDPKTRFQEKYGPWAMVTGGSSGIGYEFARQLAERGLNVVLVARHAGPLEQAAAKLRDEFGVGVKTAAVDLADRNCLEPLQEATKGLDVGLLVNDAGTWQEGPLLQTDPDKQMQVVDLNVRAPMMLTHEFGRRMAERGRGGIINVASTLAYQAAPYHANYAATKAYSLLLSEGLAAELKPHGVDVLAVSPGPTHTEGTSGVDMDRIPFPKSEPGDVVSNALAALGRKSSTIPGFANNVAVSLSGTLLPRGAVTSIAGHVGRHVLGLED